MSARVIDVSGLVDAAPRMDERGVEEVQCESCKEWWPEDDPEVPSESDHCTISACLCRDCRQEVNES